MSRTIKILAIDGGGIRGIIPAIILGEIERRTGQHIAHLFDLIAGSSTGGLLTMGLTKPDTQGQPQFTAEELAMFYEYEGPIIFSRSMWHRMAAVGNITGSKYPTDGIEMVLQRCFGDVMLSEAVGNVLVTSYEIQHRKPWFFRSRKARQSPNCDFLMREVIRATTAAPTYFEPAQLFHMTAPDAYYALVDGGLQANNPALCALIEAQDKNPEASDFLLVSIGTGEHTRSMDFEEARQWGLAGWAQHLLQVVFDAMSSTVDYQVRHLLPICRDGRQHYYRFQIPLIGASDDFDNIDPKNFAGLKALAQEMIQQNDALLDQLIEQLLQ